jgi:hypothetical protein
METCLVCGKQLKTPASLLLHVKFKHKDLDTVPQPTPQPSLPSMQPVTQPNIPPPSQPVVQPVTQYPQSQTRQLTVEDVVDIVERTLERRLGSENDGHSEFLGKEVQIRSVGMPRSVPVSPIVQFYYEYTNSNGGEYKNLTEFIDDVVTEHFSECLGLELSVIKRRAFERGGGVSRWVR